MRYAYVGYFNGIDLTYHAACIMDLFAYFNLDMFSSSFSETSIFNNMWNKKYYNFRTEFYPVKICSIQFHYIWGSTCWI